MNTKSNTTQSQSTNKKGANMQKAIIQAIETFAFDSTSATTQYNLEMSRLHNYLGQVMPAKQALDKYKQINNNVKAYFASNYNIIF